jgi:class 3 adenylate cyclase
MSKLLAPVVDLGVTPGMPMDLAFALRATNLVAALLSLVSIAAIGMALADAHSVGLAFAISLHLLGYLSALFLTGAGFHNAGRFAFLAVGGAHYCTLLVAIGAQAGVRMYMIAMVVYPSVGFARIEGRKATLAYVMIGVTFVTSELLANRFGPLLPLSPASVENGQHFILIGVCALVGFGMRYYQDLAFRARQQLDAANRRITELLANVLPPPIAARLEHQPQVIADSHGEATVLFADLAGFSTLARRLSPSHLVEVLNLIFSRFDEAAAGHGIEKIKTIGDCYMAATGVLNEGAGRTAVEAMADFSLDLLGIVERSAAEIGLPLGVRIGISSGPVISGVIGKRKYSFDVWGDTVNLASRMQSAGLAGRVQVSEATYWRLQHAFEFETRGTVAVKGIGETPAYLLVARKRNEAGSLMNNPG